MPGPPILSYHKRNVVIRVGVYYTGYSIVTDIHSGQTGDKTLLPLLPTLVKETSGTLSPPGVTLASGSILVYPDACSIKLHHGMGE